MKVESGAAAGVYFYTRDHLGSIRELTDSNGNVRGRYSYDPFGRRTRVSGDVEADFGFAGMFWSPETSLFLTHYRAYDPELGRWLSRDPLPDAEMLQGPNLYAYVGNNAINSIDPSGLAGFLNSCTVSPLCVTIMATTAVPASQAIQRYGPSLQRVAPSLPRANQALQCARNTAPQIEAVAVRFQTLPGVGPDTINMFSRTAPIVNQAAPIVNQAAPPLRDMALVAKRFRDFEASLVNDPAGRFWQQWMDASQYWREHILTQEQAREVVMWISRWTDSLFSK